MWVLRPQTLRANLAAVDTPFCGWAEPPREELSRRSMSATYGYSAKRSFPVQYPVRYLALLPGRPFNSYGPLPRLLRPVSDKI